MDAVTGAGAAAFAATFFKSLISLQVLKRLLSLLVTTQRNNILHNMSSLICILSNFFLLFQCIKIS